MLGEVALISNWSVNSILSRRVLGFAVTATLWMAVIFDKVHTQHLLLIYRIPLSPRDLCQGLRVLQHASQRIWYHVKVS